MIKFIIISFYLILLISCENIGEGYDWNEEKSVGFSRKFGTIGYDYGWNSAHSPYDNGIIVVGSQAPEIDGNKDLWAIKTDERGLLKWNKSIGGTNNDEGYDVVATFDGGYIFVGYTWSYGNEQQAYIIKTDLFGNIIWEKNYGGIMWEVATSIKESSNGNYIITGFTNSPGISSGNTDILLMKIDSNGSLLWLNAYGNQEFPNHEWGYDLVEVNDVGYIIVGSRDRYDRGSKNLLLISTDYDGKILWEKEIFTENNINQIGYSIAMGLDGFFYISSSINSTNNKEIYNQKILKIDSSGNVVWERSYSNNGKEYHQFNISAAQNGDLILTGSSIYDFKMNSKSDAYLTRINREGNILWSFPYGTSDEDDWGWSLHERPDGNIIMVGSTKSFNASLFDVYLMGVNSEGVRY